MNSIRTAAALALACSQVWVGAAQESPLEIPRDPAAAFARLLRYPLPDGALVHDRDRGEVVRLDGAGRQLAKASVRGATQNWLEGKFNPRRSGITSLVLSGDFSHALMVHRDDDSNFRANDEVWLLGVDHLEKLRDFPLGRCDSWPLATRLPAVTDRVTMLCRHSRPPDDAKRKPTLAIVTIDTNRGEIARWSAVGGERRGLWLGPMFLEWIYNFETIEVERTDTCLSENVQARGFAGSDSILVVNRDGETIKGEVWAVDMRGLDAPRQLWTLEGHPRSATICTLPFGDRLLQVTVDPRTMKQIRSERSVPPEAWVQTFELHASPVEPAAR